MKRNLSSFFLCVVLLAAVFAGCGTANQLIVPTEITRPPVADPSPKDPYGARVAVMDFSYKPPDEPNVVGRDYDRVRQIIWEGDPGSLLADLVAGALSERGVSVSRLKAGDPATDDFSSVVNGAVRRFNVDIRRRNMINIYMDATVEMTLSVSGRNVSVPWETSISSNSVQQEVLPLPNYIRETLSSVANSAADEAVRRLQERGVAGSRK